MKQYDEIDYYGDFWGIPTIAFDKIDGSNLRFEYSHKRGFYKSGTRKMMIDRNHEQFGFAIDLFMEKYSEGLTKIFKSKDYRNSQSFVCFAELVGTKSKFGQHEFGNDEFDITLFDIDQYKRGLIPPREFINNFGELGIPRIVYEGNLNKEFIAAVKRNDFNLKEGTVNKSVIKTKKGNENLFYCKVKTDKWFEELRAYNSKLFDDEISQSLKITK
jgi:hypothetical protein